MYHRFNRMVQSIPLFRSGIEKDMAMQEEFNGKVRWKQFDSTDLEEMYANVVELEPQEVQGVAAAFMQIFVCYHILNMKSRKLDLSYDIYLDTFVEGIEIGRVRRSAETLLKSVRAYRESIFLSDREIYATRILCCLQRLTKERSFSDFDMLMLSVVCIPNTYEPSKHSEELLKRIRYETSINKITKENIAQLKFINHFGEYIDHLVDDGCTSIQALDAILWSVKLILVKEMNLIFTESISGIFSLRDEQTFVEIVKEASNTFYSYLKS